MIQEHFHDYSQFVKVAEIIEVMTPESSIAQSFSPPPTLHSCSSCNSACHDVEDAEESAFDDADYSAFTHNVPESVNTNFSQSAPSIEEKKENSFNSVSPEGPRSTGPTDAKHPASNPTDVVTPPSIEEEHITNVEAVLPIDPLYDPLETTRRFIFSVHKPASDGFDDFLFNRVFKWLSGVDTFRSRNRTFVDQLPEMYTFENISSEVLRPFLGFSLRTRTRKTGNRPHEALDVVNKLGYRSCTSECIYIHLVEYMHTHDEFVKRSALNPDGTVRSATRSALASLALKSPNIDMYKRNMRYLEQTIDYAHYVMAVRDIHKNGRTSQPVFKPDFGSISALNTPLSRGVQFA
jgi:hypothetical protein